MSDTNDIRRWYREQFQARERALPGANLPWLAKRRRWAMEQFLDLGFPTLRHEDWKYTDVRSLATRRFVLAPPASIEASVIAALDLGMPHRLVFVDGRYAPSLSRIDRMPAGVRVGGLVEALAREPDEIQSWLDRQALPDSHGFEALNVAFLEDGACLFVGKDVEVRGPVHALFVSTGAADIASHIRNRIVAGAGSRATIIESYAALGPGAYLTNTVTEVELCEGATLEHYRLEREGETASHIGGTRVRQARDSRYTSHAIALGGRLVRHGLDCALDAEGAECALNGLYLARGRGHVDNHTRIDHLKPRTTSREWYKGVLDDHARGVFSGRVVVHPQAQHTDAEQHSRNLLLSSDAEADSRPQLEIYADDVKCAHGSSTGSLNPDQLFYLRARGLDEPLARNQLVYAFAADVLARMKLAAVRIPLERHLAGQLLPAANPEELIA
jgi:Fe-S cluster assembly protein SufD